MVWAAFTLAFFGFLRCSEFTYQGVNKYSSRFDLGTECVSFVPSLASPQHMVITLRSSKTDPFRAGQSLLIARADSSLCAVTAMQHYFEFVLLLRVPFLFFSLVISLPGPPLLPFCVTPHVMLGYPSTAPRVIVFA